MPASNPDDSLLLIRCPSCGQRFKVGEDLRDRTVECGGCEHRFRIDDDSIVRGRKFYPGERSDPGLNRFQRVPLSRADAPAGMQQMNYSNAPDPAVLEPASPLRILAGGIGAAGIVFMGLLLMFGARRGGLLDGMITRDRIVMAAFAAVVGTILLIYANPRARLKGLLVGLLLGCGAVAVPFFFQEGSVPLDATGNPAAMTGNPDDSAPAPKPAGDPKTQELRDLIGTAPLDDEIAKLEREGSDRRAMGIWLRGLSESNRYLVRDYVIRAADAHPSSHQYPRGDGAYLMVVTGLRMTLQDLAEIAAPLGEITNLYPDVSVIEVKVRNENFVEGPLEKLTDKTDPAFYELNKRELESIDLQRVKRAVERLATAEPKIYQDDISRKLIELMADDAVDFKAQISTALGVWSARPGLAGDAALAELKKLVEAKSTVPPELIGLLVHEKVPGVIPVLDALWAKNSTEWESYYADVGPAAEAPILRRFPETEGIVRYSAIRLLGKVGGADSLAVLAEIPDRGDAELRVLIDNARTSIERRIAN